ncbi:unnamed protein product [Tilletia controversa]|nr:unnamed protein product [Tilletia controversa]
MNANVAVEARPTRSASNKSNLPASSYSSKPQYCSRLFPVPTRYTFLRSKASLLRLNVRNRVFYAATLLEAGHREEAQQQLDEALKIFAGGCEGMGRVEKTARVIRARALEAAGQAEEAAAERVRAEAMPFEGFAHRLGRLATG